MTADDFAPPGLHVIWRDGMLWVEGEADMHTAPFLLVAIDRHIVGKSLIRLETSKLMFCDSSCLAVFLRVMSNNKRLILVRPSAPVRRAVELLGMLDVEGIEIED